MGKDDGTERSKPLEGAQVRAGAQGGLVGAFTTVMDALDFRVGGRTKFKASEISLITLCSIASGGTSVALQQPSANVQQPVPLAAGC